MAIISNSPSRGWGYSSVALYVLLTLDAIYFMYKFPFCRARIGLSTVVASVGGLIYSIIDSGLLVSTTLAASTALFVFMSIFNAFTFLPGVIAFYNISQERKSELGTFFGYIGFAWTVITPVIGLVITIFMAIAFTESLSFLEGFYAILRSFNYANWVYIGIYFVYVPLYANKLDQRARFSMFSYVGLLVFYMAAYSIISNISVDSYMVAQMITFLLISLPMAIAILIAILFSSTWKLESLDKNANRDIESTITEEKIE